MREPRLDQTWEDHPPQSRDDYGRLMRFLAGQLGPMNDFYVPLIDVAKMLTEDTNA